MKFLLIVAAYICGTLLQLSAIRAGLGSWTHHLEIQASDLWVTTIAAILAIIPGIGGMVASFGAIEAWSWPAFCAFGLFFVINVVGIGHLRGAGSHEDDRDGAPET